MLLLGLPASAAGQACVGREVALRAAVDSFSGIQQNVGVAVAVASVGRVVYSEGFGFADLEHRVAVTPATRFAVASLTKAFAPGFLHEETWQLVWTRPRFGELETGMGFGWFVRPPADGPPRIHINGSNPGVQAGLFVYRDTGLVIAVLTNSLGKGAESGAFASGGSEGFPALLHQACTNP